MKYSFETTANVPTEKIWPLYAEVNHWFKWEDDLQAIDLNGKFETGTTGTMTLAGMPPLAFTLTEVQENRSFSDLTAIPDLGKIIFHHELISVKDSQTIVRHSVEFAPYNRKESIKDIEFIGKIFADVPKSIFALIAVAEND